MTFASNALNGLGLILLIHAIYSAHEVTSALPTPFTTSPSTPSTPSSSSSSSSSAPIADATALSSLPLDITIELLLAVLLLSIGIVLASAPLRPIMWREWAGEVERRKGNAWERGEGGFGNPFAGLEERAGFLDVRQVRREYAGWVKGGG